MNVRFKGYSDRDEKGNPSTPIYTFDCKMSPDFWKNISITGSGEDLINNFGEMMWEQVYTCFKKEWEKHKKTKGEITK